MNNEITQRVAELKSRIGILVKASEMAQQSDCQKPAFEFSFSCSRDSVHGIPTVNTDNPVEIIACLDALLESVVITTYQIEAFLFGEYEISDCGCPKCALRRAVREKAIFELDKHGNAPKH